MPAPDVWITAVSPAGPSVGFGLADVATTSQFSSGAGVWTVVDRPRRKSFLEFTANPLVQLALPLILDAADVDGSIERSASIVDSWIRPTPQTSEPPLLSVSGPVEQYGVARWACQTIAWGTTVQRRRDGARTQHDVTLTLIEWTSSATSTSPLLAAQLSAVTAVLTASGVTVPPQLAAVLSQLPSLLQTASPALTAAVTTQIAAFLSSVPDNPAGSATIVADALPALAQILPALGAGREYYWRDGDTLARVAARELGDFRREWVIATLNGIRDPRRIVTGQKVLLP